MESPFKHYGIKINADISSAAITRQISAWTKSAAKEKMQAHGFACSLMRRYVKHGNRDELYNVAEAIGVKFGEPAKFAFIEWIVKNTNLTFDPKAEESKDKFRGPKEKGAERRFNTEAESDVEIGKKGDRSFFSMVKKTVAPWDADAAVSRLIAKCVDEDLSQEDLINKINSMWTAAAVEARKKLERAAKKASETKAETATA